MKKYYRLSFCALLCFVLFLFTGCSKEITTNNEIQSLTGYAQKGPFISGSTITVFDLESDLSPTGRTYNAEIINDDGAFELNDIGLNSNYVSIKADGFYFNEITGRESIAQISLYALSDITESTDINVNILTDIERPRVGYLVAQGKSFSEAKTQAQKEVLAIFNIVENDLSYSEELDISQGGDDNAILLAVSAIVQGNRTESELTQLLSKIRNDLKEDGVLTSSTLGSELISHAVLLDTASIRSNLKDRFVDLDIQAIIPNFRKYITNFITETDFIISSSGIIYPDRGLYGENILKLSKTSYNGGDQVYQSLNAQIAAGGFLKIKVTSLPTITLITDSGAMEAYSWAYYYPETANNWSISEYDNNKHSQMFTAIQSNKVCELKMCFDKGSFLIEYFEINGTLPSRRKTITVK